MEAPGGQPRLRALVDWLEGQLDEADAAAVENAVLAGDPNLTRTVTWLRQFLANTGAHRLEPAPPLVRQQLGQYFRRWSAGVETASAHPAPPPVVGQLVFDSRIDRRRMAVRTSTEVDELHLGFTSGLADLLLDVTPAAGGLVRVEGQVLRTAEDDAPVFAAEMVTPEFTMRTLDGDEHGRFGFEPSPPLPARLTVDNGRFSMIVAFDPTPLP